MYICTFNYLCTKRQLCLLLYKNVCLTLLNCFALYVMRLYDLRLTCLHISYLPVRATIHSMTYKSHTIGVTPSSTILLQNNTSQVNYCIPILCHSVIRKQLLSLVFPHWLVLYTSTTLTCTNTACYSSYRASEFVISLLAL